MVWAQARTHFITFAYTLGEVGQTQNHKAELGYTDGGTAERGGGRRSGEENENKNKGGGLQKEGKGEGGLKRTGQHHKDEEGYTDGRTAERGGSRKTFKKRGE